MARPTDSKTQAALETLRHQPMTARELCATLGLPERTVKDICHRLVARGQVQVVQKQRHKHARRPVACYGQPSAASLADWMSTLWR